MDTQKETGTFLQSKMSSSFVESIGKGKNLNPSTNRWQYRGRPIREQYFEN